MSVPALSRGKTLSQVSDIIWQPLCCIQAVLCAKANRKQGNEQDTLIYYTSNPYL